MKDLVIIAPCGAYKEVFDALLGKRQASLGIRSIEWHVVVDILHDSSGNLDTLARPYAGQFAHALALRDLAGSGWEGRGSAAFQSELKRTLQGTGRWSAQDCEAIVVEPEIEDWLRMPSANLWQMVAERARRNQGKVNAPDNRQAFLSVLATHPGVGPYGKPLHPKEIFEDLMRHYGIPPANSLYGYLAERESLQNCASPTFARLLALLQRWFP